MACPTQGLARQQVAAQHLSAIMRKREEIIFKNLTMSSRTEVLKPASPKELTEAAKTELSKFQASAELSKFQASAVRACTC